MAKRGISRPYVGYDMHSATQAHLKKLHKTKTFVVRKGRPDSTTQTFHGLKKSARAKRRNVLLLARTTVPNSPQRSKLLRVAKMHKFAEKNFKSYVRGGGPYVSYKLNDNSHPKGWDSAIKAYIT
jgi:hypothetical protein